MPSFRTEITLTPSSYKMDYKARLITIGSCFSNSIGERLKENKFNCLINPFGTLFNPLAIHQVLEFAIHNNLPSEDSYLFHEDVWKNYYFHSSFFSPSKDELKAKIKATGRLVNDFLKTTDYLIITYGTAYVYEHNEIGRTVANCHKQPAQQFTKRLLTLEEITSSFNAMVKALHKVNPACKILLTVSPVRHLKDTLELNSVSKSVLRVAVHQLKERGAVYFPSYEIVLDDLRDYRFYEADMIHPNAQAIDYLWDKFLDCYFTPDTLQLMQEWQKIKSALNHQPFHEPGKAYQAFLKKTLLKLKKLYPLLDIDQEIGLVKSKIQ